MKSADLSTSIGDRKIRLANPFIAASGTYGYGTEYSDLCPAHDWGAVILKSISLDPRKGNKLPRCTETKSGMLNSIGLANVGLKEFLAQKLPALLASCHADAFIVANLAAESNEEFIALCDALQADGRVQALEINISCPNVSKGGMQFGADPQLAAEVVSACRAHTTLPLWVKLSPNVTDAVAIARAVVEAGADALVACNTLLGMKIDVENRKPVLGNVFGGLSGPAVLPVNLRIAWQIHKALPEIPLIGCGGVEDADGALQYLLAGCCAVEVGTATFRNPHTLYRIMEGLQEYMENHGHTKLSEIIGAAHKR